MDSKPPHSYLAHLAWIVPSVIALLAIVLDHMDMASALLSKLWNLFFVNIWYIWFAAAGYGLYRFVRLIQNFHNVTNKVIPGLMTAHAEITDRNADLVKKESASRVLAIDTLSNRIDSLDTRVQKDLNDGLWALKGQLIGAIKNEAHERTEGINAISHRIDVDFERMNNIERFLPLDISRATKEIETRFDAQIAALNKRVEKVEPKPSLNMFNKALGLADATPEGLFGLGNSTSKVPSPTGLLSTPKSLPDLTPPTTPESRGLINTITRSLTPEEKVAQAILDRNKNKKAT